MLYFVTNSWGFLVLYVMRRMRFGARLRDLAVRVSRFRLVQAAIVMSLFFLVLQVVQLPFDAYEYSIDLQCGLSVQHWGSWFGDWAKNLALVLLGCRIAGWACMSRCAAVRDAGGFTSGWVRSRSLFS